MMNEIDSDDEEMYLYGKTPGAEHSEEIKSPSKISFPLANWEALQKILKNLNNLIENSNKQAEIP